jgi:hypothetical protein
MVLLLLFKMVVRRTGHKRLVDHLVRS